MVNQIGGDNSRIRILLLDLETQPNVVYTWGVYEENAIEVKEHWQLLSFSAKWYGGEHITKGLCDYKGYRAGGSDEKLVKELWHLVDSADVVVGHNARDFDIKKLNARFIAHGLKPPSPYVTVDTKNEVKRVAGFSSNKLDWLCSQLELGRKVEHEGFALWKKCMQGNRKAWSKMKKYNRHDIILLEKLYVILSPWMRQPNAGIYLKGTVCPNPVCGSKNLKSRGWQFNKTTKYRRIVCMDCGKWSRTSHNESDIKPLIGL